MKARIEKLSAITLQVAHMEASVRFYREVLGMELLYGGPNAGFCSLRIPGTEFPIINLQHGRAAARWGRMVFHVADVDAFWTHLKEKGLKPDNPRNASWGERYFHIHDPDGYELSFATTAMMQCMSIGHHLCCKGQVKAMSISLLQSGSL